MRVHLIKNNIVNNTVEMSSLNEAVQIFPDFLCIDANSVGGGPGYRYENGEAFLPEPNLEIIANEIRLQRNNLLRENVDTMNSIRWESMTEEQKTVWREYRQALLDVPQQNDFPLNIVWPNIPQL